MMRNGSSLIITVGLGLILVACSDDSDKKPDGGTSDLARDVGPIVDGPRSEKPILTELGTDQAPKIKAWLSVGNTDFSGTNDCDHVSLFVYDNSGTALPYVAFSEAPSYKVTVMALDATTNTWKHVGTPGFSDDRADFVKLTVVTENSKPVPYVAFKQQGTELRGVVMRYTGNGASGWEKVGGDGLLTSISAAGAFDGATPYLAVSRHDETTDEEFLQVKKLQGSSWVQVGADVKLEGGEEEWSLAFDGSVNPPAIVMSMRSGQKPWVLKHEGSGWVTLGAKEFTTDEVEDISLFVEGGNIYLASKNDKTLKATVHKYDATAKDWKPMGNEGISAGEMDWTTLFVASGVPYLGYQDFAHNNYATVMSYQSSTNTWAPVGAEGFSTPRGVSFPSLFVFKGVPFFGFDDSTHVNVMKYDFP